MLLIGFSIFQYLLSAKRRTCSVLACGISYHSREITYKKYHMMSKILKVTKFVDQNRVPQVKVGRGRIKPRFYTKRLSSL